MLKEDSNFILLITFLPNLKVIMSRLLLAVSQDGC